MLSSKGLCCHPSCPPFAVSHEWTKTKWIKWLANFPRVVGGKYREKSLLCTCYTNVVDPIHAFAQNRCNKNMTISEKQQRTGATKLFQRTPHTRIDKVEKKREHSLYGIVVRSQCHTKVLIDFQRKIIIKKKRKKSITNWQTEPNRTKKELK